MKRTLLSAATAGFALTLAACGNEDTNTGNTADTGENNAAENETGADNEPDTENNETENENSGAEETGNESMNEENNASADEESNETEETAWYEDLNFEEFELDAEYENGEYEVEYEYNDGDPEAEIEDSRGGEDVEMEGQEALDELEPMLTQLDLTADSEENEVFDQVMEAFDLEDNYDELEVEIEFFDDEELEAENE